MLFNYLKISVRLLSRNPVLSLINIVGLSVGFLVFFILWQYTRSELATDQFHPDWQRIVRCGSAIEWTDDNAHWEGSKNGVIGTRIINYITATYPEVEAYSRIITQNFFDDAANDGLTKDHGKEIVLAYTNHEGGTTSFLEENVIYADTNFFQFFTVPLIAGSPTTALSAPTSIVLSRKRATAYFGTGDPIGKTLMLNDSIPLFVTAVFEDLPTNTHLDFDIVLSMERVRHTWPSTSLGRGVLAYFKLTAGTNADSLQNKINDESRAKLRDLFWGKWGYGKAEILFQPLSDIAFHRLRWDVYSEKSASLLHVFQGASWMILGMAWINYIILTISFNLRRLKEQLVRKTNGARISDMLAQFITESALIHVIAILFAASVLQLIKEPLRLALGFYLPSWSTIPAASIGLIIVLLTCSVLFTGLYPALVALKRAYSTKAIMSVKKAEKSTMTHALTVLQFSVAIVMIVCVFIVYLQNHYVLGKQIGLNRDQVLVVDLPIVRSRDFDVHVDKFIADIAAISGVETATRSYSVAGNDMANYVHLKRPDLKGDGMNIESDGGVDENFIPFFGIKLIAGRNFTRNSPVDERSVILSEAAARRIGIDKPEDALGTLIQVDNQKGVEIIGIINDYQVKPFLKGVSTEEGYSGKAGLALTYKQHVNLYAKARKLSIKISPAVFAANAKSIASTFKSHFPDAPFRYTFLDDQINQGYQYYSLALLQIIFFTVIAIGIACIGLLGVMTNNVISRTKELGIRKVMGASVFELGRLLMNDTIRQIAVATVLGLSLAIYLSRAYLQEFSERISPSWWTYAFPTTLFFVILLTVVMSILARAATRNPVDSLRHE